MRLGFLLIFLFSALSSLAQDTSIVLIGPSYPGLIEPTGDGRYQRHVKAALKGQGIQIEERVLPTKRALLSFLDQGGDCIYSMTLPVQTAGHADQMLKSPALTKVKMLIFQRKGNPPVVSVQQLPEKTHIGGVIGNEAYYKESQKKGHVLEYVTEDKINIDKLRYNRIGYIYGFFPNLDAYRNELSYNEKKPILEIPDSITCYQNERTKKFISVLNQNLKTVVEEDFKKQKVVLAEESKVSKILMLKDLLADILPPPLFAIQSHLVSLQIGLEIQKNSPDEQKVDALIEKAMKIRQGDAPSGKASRFEDRFQYWSGVFAKSIEQTAPWVAFRDEAAVSARKYFEVCDQQFFPALKKQDWQQSQKILNAELVPVYAQHRIEIDNVVSRILVAEELLKEKPQQLIQMKDFLIDVFPPPLFLVESFLTLQRISSETMAAPSAEQAQRLNQLILSHKALEGNTEDLFDTSSYRSRMAFWKQAMRTHWTDEPEIRAQLEKSFKQGEKYYGLVNARIAKVRTKDKSSPVVEIGSGLEKLFDEHQKTIEELVRMINRRVETLQTQKPASESP